MIAEGYIMSSTIQIREDDDRRVTPSPYLPLSEEDMMKKLERSREYSKRGSVKSADDVISDMRSKYGL